jgi:60 kDa SS-A/Ro ribonucleoprotein
VIVATDEQSHDGILPAWTKEAYMINVAPYQSGISYGNGWTHIDAWSERVLDYIAAMEKEAAD